jgi:hypothetical protein
MNERDMGEVREDCAKQQDLTLTERVGRIEGFLHAELGVEPWGVTKHVTSRMDRVDAHMERATRAPEQTAFEEIINRIQGGTDRVCMIADRLEKIGNRVFGPLNEIAGDGSDGAEKIADGTLDHTFLALNWLDQALSRLQSAATRLERV